MRNWIKFLFLPVMSMAALALGFNNCSSQTDGLPPALNGLSNATLLTLNLGSVNLQSVGNISICPEGVALIPSQPNIAPVVFQLVPRALTLGSNSFSFSTLMVPLALYDHVELTIGSGSACQEGIQFTNASGTFESSDTVTIKFSSPFSVSEGTSNLNLEFQPILDQLGSVSSDSQVDGVVTTTSGQLALAH